MLAGHVIARGYDAGVPVFTLLCSGHGRFRRIMLGKTYSYILKLINPLSWCFENAIQAINVNNVIMQETMDTIFNAYVTQVFKSQRQS